MTTCLCRTDPDGRRLAWIPWSAPTRPGCPTHLPDLCPATTRQFRSSSTGQPIDTPCPGRLDAGRCPNSDQHAEPEGATP